MIQAPATLAMLGGGQLGRFFVSAAHELGYKVIVLDPDPNSPAGRIADEHLAVPFNDAATLKYIADNCAAATTEWENVPAETLDTLATSIPVFPTAECVAIAQDRIREKTFLRDSGLPTAPFLAINSESDLDQADASLFPAILKTARGGYDGKGQARVKNAAEAKAAFAEFNVPCILEQMLSLDLEISVVLARNSNGECRPFAVAENQHTHGILDVSIAPARIRDELRQRAEQLACTLADKLNYVGTLAVELFICGDEVLVNEIAPRPHNSGHYTIDACITNQFEQQVRALCGLPLGANNSHSAAVMVNLLGDIWFNDSNKAQEPDWQTLTSIPELKLHLYGKHEARPGRKMGHFTVIGQEMDQTVQTALAARKAIGIKDD